MRGGAEPVESEPLTRLDAAQSQGAIADDAGAEQRRGFVIGKARWNGIGKPRRHDRIFRIPAVDLIAGELRLQT